MKHYRGMKQKLRKFKITAQNDNSESLVEPEIFQIFQHKVERTLHFTCFSEIVHIVSSKISKNIFRQN